MKLLLTSAGLVPEVSSSFLSLLTKKPADNKVVYIITAAAEESDGPNPQWLAYYHKQFSKLGFNLIEEMDIKEYSAPQLKSALKDKDVIFVGGGNTFYLLYWIKKNGLEEVLRQKISQGAIYVGASAGSYIACPTIEVANWKHPDRNKVKLQDLNALNLVPFLISAHYEIKYQKLLEECASKTAFSIVALTDDQAVLVNQKSVRVIGGSAKNFYNGFKESNLYK